MKKLFVLLCILSLLSSAGSLMAEEVPLNLQAVLITKILGYDFNLGKTTQAGSVIVGLLYNDDAKSKAALQGITKELSDLRDKGVKVKGFSLGFTPVFISDKLVDELKSKNIGVVYIVNGDAANIAAIVTATQKAGVLSIVGSNADKCLSGGVAIGIKNDNDRPSIVLNLQSVAKEGHDFSGDFMSVVKIMR